MFEKFVPPEVHASLQKIANGQPVSVTETVPSPSPAKVQMTKKAQTAHFIASVLSTVTEGINGEQCVGKEEYFFNEEDDTKPVKDLKEKVAAALCSQCPIASRCLERSIEHEEEFGLWGGLNEYHRRRIIRRINKNKFNPAK